MENWNGGIMEWWNNGKLEWWKIGWWDDRIVTFVENGAVFVKSVMLFKNN